MEIQPLDDEYFMRQALIEAQKGFEMEEVPVGAVIVCKNKIIARSHNFTERLTDFTAHAEMQAFTSASEYLGNKYLTNCTLYVTLEPCTMCAGACFWTRIGKIVFGASDERRGYQRLKDIVLHPSTEVIGGILATESSELLKQFFLKKRT